MSWFKFNKIEIQLDELREHVYENLKSADDVLGLKRAEPNLFEELVLNRTKSGSYLILDDLFCLLASRSELPIINLFLFPSVPFAIKRDTGNFIKLNDLNEQVEQLIVLKKGTPYSDCDQSNSRFYCLNECFKRNFRLSRYFFDGNENGLIHLKSDSINETNQTIKESERTCFFWELQKRKLQNGLPNLVVWQYGLQSERYQNCQIRGPSEACQIQLFAADYRPGLLINRPLLLAAQRDRNQIRGVQSERKKAKSRFDLPKMGHPSIQFDLLLLPVCQPAS